MKNHSVCLDCGFCGVVKISDCMAEQSKINPLELDQKLRDILKNAKVSDFNSITTLEKICNEDNATFFLSGVFTEGNVYLSLNKIDEYFSIICLVKKEFLNKNNECLALLRIDHFDEDDRKVTYIQSDKNILSANAIHGKFYPKHLIRKCDLFFRYVPGFNPEQHLGLQQEEKRHNMHLYLSVIAVIIAILSFLFGVYQFIIH